MIASLRHSSAMQSSPRSPSRAIRILSSDEKVPPRRTTDVFDHMFGRAFAASRLRIHVRSSVFDENRTLLKSHPQFCAIGADSEQASSYRAPQPRQQSPDSRNEWTDKAWSKRKYHFSAQDLLRLQHNAPQNRRNREHGVPPALARHYLPAARRFHDARFPLSRHAHSGP